MIRTGVVVEKKGAVLEVIFDRPTACTNCSGCLNKTCSRVEIKGTADVGDTVEVDMPDGDIVKASALMYIIPVCMFLLGLLLGYLVYQSGAVHMTEDLFYAVCGVVSCAMGLGVVWVIDKRLGKKQHLQPKLIAVHKPEDKNAD